MTAPLDAGTYAERCRALTHDVVVPARDRWDRANAFPADVHAAADALGLLNVALPAELGGGGLRYRDIAEGGRVLARACAPIAFTLGFNHGALRPVVVAGTEAQRARVRELVRSRGYASWCMTEPDVSGSNLLAVRTRAERVAGGWRLTGHKCMVGNGTVASLFFVLADAWDGGTQLGPTIFMVPREAGVVVGPNSEKVGFRALPTPDVHLDGVEVDGDAVVGRAGDGLPVLLDSLDFMRFGGGIVLLGLVEGALADALDWALEREVWGGQRLADASHVQIGLGKIAAEALALERLLLDVGARLDAGTDCRREASALKLLGSELAVRATGELVQLAGWRGIDARFPMQKRWRDARQTTIYEGTSEVQAMNLFRALVASHRRGGA